MNHRRPERALTPYIGKLGRSWILYLPRVAGRPGVSLPYDTWQEAMDALWNLYWLVHPAAARVAAAKLMCSSARSFAG